MKKKILLLCFMFFQIQTYSYAVEVKKSRIFTHSDIKELLMTNQETGHRFDTLMPYISKLTSIENPSTEDTDNLLKSLLFFSHTCTNEYFSGCHKYDTIIKKAIEKLSGVYPQKDNDNLVFNSWA